MKNGGSFHCYVSSPEGIPFHDKWHPLTLVFWCGIKIMIPHVFRPAFLGGWFPTSQPPCYSSCEVAIARCHKLSWFWSGDGTLHVGNDCMSSFSKWICLVMIARGGRMFDENNQLRFLPTTGVWRNSHVKWHGTLWSLELPQRKNCWQLRSVHTKFDPKSSTMRFPTGQNIHGKHLVTQWRVLLMFWQAIGGFSLAWRKEMPRFKFWITKRYGMGTDVIFQNRETIEVPAF